MDKYTYLLIGIFLTGPWLAIYFRLGKKQRRRMVKGSLMGGLAGFVAEYWYFKDYWQPVSMFGHSVISLEDFLFGFTITGIAANVYDGMFRGKTEKGSKNRRKLFGGLFLAGIALMIIVNMVLGVNSILVSSFAFVLFTAIMVTLRPDLLWQSLLSGVFSIAIIIPVYSIIFNVISPDYWEKHWLLAGSRLGVSVLGNIPVTELLWYFTWGCMAGIAHNFASGAVRIKKPVVQQENTAALS